MPESLVQGKGLMYLSWFYNNFACNPAAITQTDINEFVSYYSSSGGMHDGFNYFRAFPQDAIQNVNYSKTNLTRPVLAVGAGYIPSFGGNVTINYAFYGMHALAQNVRGWRSSQLGSLDSRRVPRLCNKTARQFLWR